MKLATTSLVHDTACVAEGVEEDGAVLERHLLYEVEQFPVGSSLVKLGDYGLQYESNFSSFVQNSAANLVKLDGIGLKSELKSVST